MLKIFYKFCQIEDYLTLTRSRIVSFFHEMEVVRRSIKIGRFVNNLKTPEH